MANYITDGKEMQHLNWKNLKRVYFLRTIYKHIVRVWQNHKDTQEPEVRAEVALQPRGEKAVTEPVEKKKTVGVGAPWEEQWPAPDTANLCCPSGSDAGNIHSDLTLLPPSYLLSAFSINQTQLKAEVKGFRRFSPCRSAPQSRELSGQGWEWI